MKPSSSRRKRRPGASARTKTATKPRRAAAAKRPPPAPITPERILQIAWGFAPPLILATALNYRLFDVLDEAPQTVEELATRTGASVRGLTAILNALVGLELLASRGGRYTLTPESAAFFVSTRPAYHGAYF